MCCARRTPTPKSWRSTAGRPGTCPASKRCTPAPIWSPTRCPGGQRAFTGYLGADETVWIGHDATRLIEAGAAKGRYDDILVEQGTADPWLVEQLKPDLLEAACAAACQTLTVLRHDGYDHGYFFVATFIADHLAWHRERLE